MNSHEVRQEICEIGRRMYANGFVAANDGNISVRISDDEIWTTPTGVSKGYMSPEMLVRVDLGGNIIEGKLKPSSEVKMHLRVYQERPGIKAVVHAHPLYTTAYAVSGQPLDLPIIAEAVVMLGPVALAPYATPSTEEVPNSIAPFIKSHEAILLSNHGALTYGSDLTAAYFRMETLEFYAKLIATIASLGQQPRVLSEEQVQGLQKLRAKFAR